ncbi:MAG: outer membrane protein transport protein [Rhodocyclaceae bacterium]|nr:outer membrane protein transport protein [Rhodocyclaceae bacterium]
MKKLIISAAVAATLAPAAWATNGMNMEGYGPIATAMGGASFAYDNGNAGIINNPATLGMMASGTSRLDIAIGGLHPDVNSQNQGSSATSFFMPAIGYTRKDGNIAYGVGMMAQGGMGTKYSNSSMYGGLAGMNFYTQTGYSATDPGFENKSEVGVGRVIFPLAFNINDNFTVGGSVDFLWAGMDIKWLIDGAHFGSMMGTTSPFGLVGGSMKTAFQGAMGAGQFGSMDYGYFNFDTSSPMTQKAKSTGWAGNIGFTYKVSPALSIGGIYHAKTNLGDMKTGANGATATFAVSGGSLGPQVIPVVGEVIVKNFQWPETYGLGLSYQANAAWQIAADYKRINWSGVMKGFNMSFVASATQPNPIAQGGFAGTVLDMNYYQNWGDQNVLMLGAAYKYSAPLTLRFGVNVANNPVPNAFVTPLFPAIEQNHVMGGFGYAYDKLSELNFSATYAPKVTVTNNWAAAGGANQTISHSQTNWQLMYSQRF